MFTTLCSKTRSLPLARPKCKHIADVERRSSALRVPYIYVGAIPRRGFKTDTRPPARFTYKVAAAFSAKGNRFNKERDHFRFDSTTGQHWAADEPVDAPRAISTKYQSGQDAFFVSSIGGQEGSAAFGVADGVGGYIDQGIDSADFAHGLCNYMAGSAASFPKGFSKKSSTTLEPLPLLQVGYERVCHDETISGGGSTACLGIADAAGSLRVANLGDSGFIQLRLNAVHHYSFPQTHAFNTPFQLSRVPPKVLAQLKNFGGKAPFSDMPDVASITEHELRHGDVLVFATDGVWDNLSSQEILERAARDLISNGAWTVTNNDGVSISKALPWLTNDGIPGTQGKESMTIQTLMALNIVNLAKRVSLDQKRDGPFAKAVQREFPNERWHGGKADDIAVVVVIAVNTAQE